MSDNNDYHSRLKEFMEKESFLKAKNLPNYDGKFRLVFKDITRSKFNPLEFKTLGAIRDKVVIRINDLVYQSYL